MTSSEHTAPVVSYDFARSYGQVIERLVAGTMMVSFFGPDGRRRWTHGEGPVSAATQSVLAQLLRDDTARSHAGRVGDDLVAITLPIRSEATTLAVVVLHVLNKGHRPESTILREVAATIAPAIDCLTRELTQALAPKRTSQIMTERTEELEWLFSITSDMRDGDNDVSALQHLISAAVDRMQCTLGAVCLPEKRVEVSYLSKEHVDSSAGAAYRQCHPYVLSYLQRRKQPLLANGSRARRTVLPPCKIMALPIMNSHESVEGFIVFIRSHLMPDFARRQLFLARHLSRQIETLIKSQYDLATGLRTRHALEQSVSEIVGGSAASDGGSLIYIDIDRMHLINETCGFDAGDEVIVRVADALAPPLLPPGAIPGRIGGDRFVVFLPGHDSDQARACSEQLQAEVNKFTVGADKHAMKVSVSCGIVRLTFENISFARALAAAELACKSAKERGRARSAIYLAADDSMIRRRGDMLAAGQLRAAIEENRLAIFGQKIVVAKAIDEIRGIECLVRVVEPGGAFVDPSVFMSAAQRFDMLRSLDRWVIHNALDALAPYGPDLNQWGAYASINISGQSMQDEDFLSDVEGWIQDSKLPPSLIVFEIAETAAVANLARVEKLMRRLRRIGCRFALDDFGAGMNSLTYLKSLPVAGIKLDVSFVRDVDVNTTSELMVRAIAQMAQSMHVDCAAAGVDSRAIMQALKSAGVGYLQGRLTHAAEPLSQVLEAAKIEQSQRMARVALAL